MKLRFESQLFIKSILAGLIGTCISCYFIWTHLNSTLLRLILTLLTTVPWLVLCFSARNQVVSALRTLSNLVSVIQDGDYSIRPRLQNKDDALSAVFVEIDALAESLHNQRLNARDASVLLRRVMEEIDVAIFAFDVIF